MASIKQETMATSSSEGAAFHPLYDTWTMYAHLPHDTDWSVHSCKKLITCKSIEEAITLFEAIPEKMVQNCMLRMMKQNIQPVWEDPKNKNGSSLSFKVQGHSVYRAWKELCYAMVSRTISHEPDILSKINGISISPKRNFSIIKIWLEDHSVKNMKNIKDLYAMNEQNVIYKGHGN